MSKDFGTLKLEGAAAARAIDCMANAGIEFNQQPAAYSAPYVEASKNGTVTVMAVEPETQAPVATGVFSSKVAHSGNAEATGSAAESMTKTARSCAYKAGGLTP